MKGLLSHQHVRWNQVVMSGQGRVVLARSRVESRCAMVEHDFQRGYWRVMFVSSTCQGGGGWLSSSETSFWRRIIPSAALLPTNKGLQNVRRRTCVYRKCCLSLMTTVLVLLVNTVTTNPMKLHEKTNTARNFMGSLFLRRNTLQTFYNPPSATNTSVPQCHHEQKLCALLQFYTQNGESTARIRF